MSDIEVYEKKIQQIKTNRAIAKSKLDEIKLKIQEKFGNLSDKQIQKKLDSINKKITKNKKQKEILIEQLENELEAYEEYI